MTPLNIKYGIEKITSDPYWIGCFHRALKKENGPMLGMKVKDKITGFSGVVTGTAYYLTGCNQALVVPAAKEDGSLIDSMWFDFQRLERVDDSLVVLDNGASPGCDKAAPKR